MRDRASLAAAVEEITLSYIARGFFRGAVVRIERGGEQALEGAWGHAVFTRQDRDPMTAGHLFDIASLTKIFTTTAVLRLISLGMLRLDAPVAPLLGFEPPLSEALGRIDVESLLTHSSGLPAWFPFYTRRGEPFTAVLEHVLTEHPPQDAVMYSDLNFMLLGKLVEAVGGKGLASAMESLVIAPLGLEASAYGPKRNSIVATEFGNRIEAGMVRDRGLSFDGWRDERVPIRGECNDGNCFYYFNGVAGHAGIFSDARDLCALGRLYVNGGQGGGTLFLDPELAAAARRDHGGGRGLGFQIGENYPGQGFGHTGFTGTYLYANSELALVAVALTNRLHAPEPKRVDDYWRAVSAAALDARGE